MKKYAGAFPTWLAPTQVKILPIADAHHEYALSVAETFKKHGMRVEVDTRNEKIGFKIRAAQLEKVPYMLIVGDKEMEEGKVAVRSGKEGDKGAVSASDFLKDVLVEIAEKRI